MKVYYDSQCELCRRYQQAIEFLARGKLDWVDLHDSNSELPQDYSKEDLLNEIHALNDQGEVLKGAEALAAIIEHIPAAERFSWLMQRDSAKKALEVFYDTSEKLRRRLMKSCPSCQNKHS